MTTAPTRPRVHQLPLRSKLEDSTEAQRKQRVGHGQAVSIAFLIADHARTGATDIARGKTVQHRDGTRRIHLEDGPEIRRIAALPEIAVVITDQSCRRRLTIGTAGEGMQHGESLRERWRRENPHQTSKTRTARNIETNIVAPCIPEGALSSALQPERLELVRNRWIFLGPLQWRESSGNLASVLKRWQTDKDPQDR